MILRRVIEHVKAQNWTAVALDFVIVVFGVFIGIQVSNWNEARVSRQLAEETLVRLHSEAVRVSKEFETHRNFHELAVATKYDLIDRLADPVACSRVDEELKELVLSVGDFPPPRFSVSIAEGLIQNGQLALIGSDDLRAKIPSIIDEIGFLSQQWTRYIRTIQDAEYLYQVAGLRPTERADATMSEWANVDSYRIETPEKLCNNPQLIAIISNAAITQDFYLLYIDQVSQKLSAYQSALERRP